MRWTNVKKALPPYGVPVLVSDGKEVGDAFRSHTNKKGEHFRCSVMPETPWDNVIEWQPKPKPSPQKAKANERTNRN